MELAAQKTRAIRLTDVQHTPIDELCSTGNGCTTGICDPNSGCTTTPVVCENSTNFCVQTQCTYGNGCLNFTRACASNASAPDAYHCVISLCEAAQEVCKDEVVQCNSDSITGVAIGSTLGTAALVGIIVGVAFAIGGGTGGAHIAYSKFNNHEPASDVKNNPLFQPSKQSHDNPLHGVPLSSAP